MLETRRAYDLVFLALRELGIVSLGDTVDPAIAQEALLVLNSIRAEYSLSNKNQVLFDRVFTPVTNMASIRLGTGGDIDVRPAQIQQVTISNGNPPATINIRLPILPYTEYRALPLTNVFSIPGAAYIDNQFPIQMLWLYPGIVPGWSLRVIGMAYQTEYEHLDDSLVDPPQWFSALYLSLALRLAPKYGQETLPAVYAQLKSVMRRITANNTMTSMVPMQNGLKQSGGGFNFWAGV